MATRNPSAMQYEGFRAMLSMAGLRQVLQAVHSATNGTNTAYTVTGAGTRRVVLLHTSGTPGDIRFNYNAAATTTSMPLLGSRYFIVDAEKDDTLNFYNTTGGAITVNVMEIE